MTIQTIAIVEATAERPADDIATLTRADVHNNEVRAFEGRKVAHRLPIEAMGDSIDANRVAGILAALTFPISLSDLKGQIEEGLAEAARRTGSVIPDAYRYTYGEDQNNGDAMAAAFKAYCGGGLKNPLDMAKLEEVVDANGIRDRFDVWMAKDLNNGMLRMNAGNVLRGKLRKGDVVRVGGQVWNAEAPAA